MTIRSVRNSDDAGCPLPTAFRLRGSSPTRSSIRSGLRSSFRVDLSVLSAFRHWSASLVSPTTRSTMPSADFCIAISYAQSMLGAWTTMQISRGNSDHLLCPSSEIRPALRWMTRDFAKPGSLIPRKTPLSASCTSTHIFSYRFLQTLPRGSRPCVRLAFTSIRLAEGLSPPVIRHARHTWLQRPEAGRFRATGRNHDEAFTRFARNANRAPASVDLQ